MRRPAPPWNARERAVVIGLLAALLVYLVTRLLLNWQYVSDPQPLHPPHEQALADRIDPNTADVATLGALPMLGEKRARDIVAYREQFAKSHPPDEPAFSRIEDLYHIRGIGRGMVQAIEPYLIFSPRKAATTKPG